MNPNQPSREQIEARLTALLLGELPDAEAQLLRYTISQDATLKKLHDELAAVIGLVREVEKNPAVVSGENVSLKLSDGRRKKLLAHFQTPRPSTKPAKELFWLKRIEVPRLIEVLVVVAIVAILAAMMLPALSSAKVKARATSKSNAIINNLRVIDAAKNQWALENNKTGDAVATMEDLKPYMQNGGPQPVAGEKYIIGKVSDEVVADLDAKKAKQIGALANRLPAGGAHGDRVQLSAEGTVTVVNEADRQRQFAENKTKLGIDLQGGSRFSPVVAPPAEIVLPQPDLPANATTDGDELAISKNGGVYSQNIVGYTDVASAAAQPPAPAKPQPSATITFAAGALDAGESFDREASKDTVDAQSRMARAHNSYSQLSGDALDGGVAAGLSGGGSGVSGDGSTFASRLNAIIRHAANGSVGGSSGELNDKNGVSADAPAERRSGEFSSSFKLDPNTFYSGLQSDENKPAGSDAKQSQMQATEKMVPLKTELPAPLMVGTPVPISGFAYSSGNEAAQKQLDKFGADADRGNATVLGEVAAQNRINDQKKFYRLQTSSAAPDGSVNGLIDPSGGVFRSLTEQDTKELAKSGSGVWTLSGKNTYSGGTTINGGTLTAGDTITSYSGNTSYSGGTTVSAGTLAVDSFQTDSDKKVVSGQSPVAGSLDSVQANKNQPVLDLADGARTVNLEVPKSARGKAKKKLKTQPVTRQLEEDRPVQKTSLPAPAPQPEILCRENNFSTFSLNVSDVSFKLAAASLENGKLPDAASIRSEEFINAFDYRDPEATAGQPVAFASERARYPFAQNRDLLRFSLKTAAAGRAADRPLNLVLLLDTSGSMERADRVAIIREAMRMLAQQLHPQDTVSVVTFARTARLWADGVSGDKAGETLSQVGGITPEGGTNLEEAMRLAYATARRHYLANGINRVVLLTDGAANLGNVDAAVLKQKVEAQRKQGIALDCFGIGWEDFNDDMLAELSGNGDGRYAFINSPEEAGTEFAAKLAGALRVAAQDVKVQVEFNPQRVVSWRQIGYAKHQLTKEQFRDNSVLAAEIAAQEAGNALYTVETKPDGLGPVATVYVRYKIPGTMEVQEHSWEVPYAGNAVALKQASAAMRLAATASAFSEWLAASPFAQEVSPDELLKDLSGVPQIYGADQRPQKLEWMIRQAKSLSGK